MDVLIVVEKQKLRLIDYINTFVEGSQNFVRFKFDLSEEWKDLTVFAQFVQNEKGYNQYLDGDNCVYLPNEIVAGTCMVVLYGTGANSTIGTTNCLNLKIDSNRIISDGSSIEITETLYQQLVDRMNNLSIEIKNDIGNSIATIPEVKTYMKI